MARQYEEAAPIGAPSLNLDIEKENVEAVDRYRRYRHWSLDEETRGHRRLPDCQSVCRCCSNDCVAIGRRRRPCSRRLHRGRLEYGAGALWLVAGDSAGLALLGLVAGRIRRLADEHGFLTLTDYVFLRFGARTGYLSFVL